ncbi:hypothetical protein LDENG_00019910, partial [Lucifuga dentata]
GCRAVLMDGWSSWTAVTATFRRENSGLMLRSAVRISMPTWSASPPSRSRTLSCPKLQNTCG